jgi:hypothetical protein
MKKLCAALILTLALCAPPAFAQQPQVFQYANITAAAPTTTTLKNSPGVLHTVCVNTPAATGTITIYDLTVGSGAKIGTITGYASTPRCFDYDVAFWSGLTIVTATAAQDITVSFRWQRA